MDIQGKVVWNLVDSTFAHHKSCNLPDFSVAGQQANFVQWDRECKQDIFFYSHEKMLEVNTPKNKSFGLIFESQSIINNTYCQIEKVINKFHTVFTHNSEWLKKYDNCLWIPGGGIWVGGDFGLGVVGIKNKTELCSIVSSNKSMCRLHNIRSYIYNNVNKNKIARFGTPWVPIYQTLDNFMFSIIVENYIDELYFTEKLLNCFATGTIPIYLGATKLNKIFNTDGVLQFTSEDELNNILKNLSSDLYYSKMSAIQENYNKCLNFKIIEDYIYQHYYPFPD